MQAHPRTAWLLAAAGAAGLLAGEAALFAGNDWVRANFYFIAWYSYILLADGVVHLRTGSSLLLSRPRSFLLLLPWSAAFWLFFELCNLLLRNWYYVGLPVQAWERYAGMAVAFATVLPGVLETSDLLRCFGLFGRARCRPFELTPRLLRAVTAAGVLCLALPLLFPRYAFPLLWISTSLLLEPWIARRGGRGLLTALASGNAAPFWRLLAAGLGAGVLWEFWNYWSPGRWIYTVPLFEEGKLFEMPVLGFLGFPPFALECYSFARFLVTARLVPEWESAEPAPARGSVPGVLAAVALAAPVLWLTDTHTVRATIPWLRHVPGMPPETVRALEERGIHTAGDLVATLREGASLSSAEAGWLPAAELMQLRGMGSRGWQWLEAAGVRSVAELAREDPAQLGTRMRSLSGPPPCPSEAEVRVWVRGAQAALPGAERP
ncbi:MAG: DUF4332 domain-containing protein [Planctomycetota bacterium]|nr:MAG: DUF4332 domain-containing protein [Planctomycetota bacterium]